PGSENVRRQVGQRVVARMFLLQPFQHFTCRELAEHSSLTSILNRRRVALDNGFKLFIDCPRKYCTCTRLRPSVVQCSLKLLNKTSELVAALAVIDTGLCDPGFPLSQLRL